MRSREGHVARGWRRGVAGIRGIEWTPRGAMMVVALAHAVVFLGLYKLQARVAAMTYYELGSDTQHVYWPAVQKLLAGHVPYLDPHFFVEYPPLGTAFFLLPALLRPMSLRAYDWLFAAEVLAVDLVTLPVLARLARREGASATGAIAAYALVVPVLGSVVSQRYDLVPATLTLGAILALLGRRSILAWILLLLATLMKLYPAVLAPLFLLYEWQPLLPAGGHPRMRKRLERPSVGLGDWPRGLWLARGPLLYAAGLAGSTLAWYLLAPASLARFAQWETRRGIEIESLWGSVAELAHLRGLAVSREVTYGSYDVASALTPALKLLSTAVTLGLLAAVYISYARRAPSPPAHLARAAGPRLGLAAQPTLPRTGRAGWAVGSADPLPRGAPEPARDGGEGPARALVSHAALAVLAVLLGSKLLSIQFLLWLLPLVAVQAYRPGRIARLMFVIVLLSQWIYPTDWNPLWRFEIEPTLTLALRNLLLVVLFALLWRHRADPVLASVAPDPERRGQGAAPEGSTRYQTDGDLSRSGPSSENSASAGRRVVPFSTRLVAARRRGHWYVRTPSGSPSTPLFSSAMEPRGGMGVCHGPVGLGQRPLKGRVP